MTFPAKPMESLTTAAHWLICGSRVLTTGFMCSQVSTEIRTSSMALIPLGLGKGYIPVPGSSKCGFGLLLKGHFRDMSVWRWLEPCFKGICACDPPDVARMDKTSRRKPSLANARHSESGSFWLRAPNMASPSLTAHNKSQIPTLRAPTDIGEFSLKVK